MSTERINKDLRNLSAQIGQAALHSQFPNDFEYYALGLDLTDSDNKILDSLVFPVMPSQIQEPRPTINSVKKSAAGVVSLYNTTFVPFDISIRGSFGRKLRILSNNGAYSFNALSGRTTGNGYDAPVYNTSVKTGYGTIKLLERICETSQSTDDKGRPVRLFYYNLALNSQYLVEFKNLTFSMDEGNNMIWHYSAVFKAIAPAYLIRANNSTSLISLLSSDVINKGLGSLINNYKSIRTNRAKITTF